MPQLIDAVVEPGALRRHPQPVLTVAELRLRPWTATDADDVVRAYQDPAIQQWHGRSMTRPEALAWIVSWADAWQAETGAGWAVTVPTGPQSPLTGPTDEPTDDPMDELVGRIGLRRLDLVAGHAECGYWVVPAARGRAVAPRALDAVSRWLFAEVGLHRLELEHAAGNDASCRVATKAGFAAEGTKRSSQLHADGWHDMHQHARVNPRSTRPTVRAG